MNRGYYEGLLARLQALKTSLPACLEAGEFCALQAKIEQIRGQICTLLAMMDDYAGRDQPA